MINFAPTAPYGKPATTAEAPPVTARPAGAPGPVSMAATDLLDSPADWSWEQLRDYVTRSIAERHGPQPRHESVKVNSVFKSFAARWGNQAGPIARFAFEDQDGFWRSGPVTLTRFMKGNDAHFAGPISERLANV
ncbi:hypothetical protein QFZ75_007928 [Streptomyces sp. V3I8]|uniref:hypothetical protein n=1 Tax=Streptomyces sp. V3I8 TaxID=3042279 RepID=UPI0027884FDD|nr:hypothetical protein [Streptomyces sp. V3I8]MDQ1041426.1 hypothetical protein [Streptomyces sp. V3I8]